jgi:glycyl-tRNA synthetase beta chain
VRSGNERVVRPRLADAAFFWEQDRRSRCPRASRHSTASRTRRSSVRSATSCGACRARRELAATCGAEPSASRAPRSLPSAICSARWSASSPNCRASWAPTTRRPTAKPPRSPSAIREHYLPRGAGDALPATPTGIALALADRIDTLAGIFAIGQKPSGTRDPFGLRRAAIGVLRMCRERALEFDLRAAHRTIGRSAARGRYSARAAAVGEEVYGYVMERLRAQYLDDAASAVTTEVFDAVLATAPRSLLDADARIAALVGFLALPEAASLAAANKRIANILKKSAAACAGGDRHGAAQAPGLSNRCTRN